MYIYSLSVSGSADTQRNVHQLLQLHKEPWTLQARLLLCYYSQPCGCSHDEQQPIGMSSPLVPSVKAAPRSQLRWLADSPLSSSARPAALERHGNGGETREGEGVVRGDSLTGPERQQQRRQ